VFNWFSWILHPKDFNFSKTLRSLQYFLVFIPAIDFKEKEKAVQMKLNRLEL